MNAISPAASFRTASAPETFVDVLNREGYVVIRNAVSQALIADINQQSVPIFAETARSRGAFYGSNTRQFRGLLTQIPRSSELVMHALVLGIVREFLSECDTIQLNSTQAIELLPKGRQQPPHRDQQVWHESNYMLASFEHSVNVMWPFTHYDRGNGTTKVWPGTHLRLDVPPLEETAIDVEMEPGDVLLFSGRVLHCQGANTSNMIRRGLIVSYALGWLRTLENMYLTYPPEVAKHFAPELAELIGYKIHRPNLGSVHGHCPSRLLADEPDIPSGVCDWFRPDQTQRVIDFHAARQAKAPPRLKSAH